MSEFTEKYTLETKIPRNFDSAENVEAQKQTLRAILNSEGDFPPIFCLFAKNNGEKFSAVRCNIVIEKLSDEEKQEIKNAQFFENTELEVFSNFDLNYTVEILNKNGEKMGVFLSDTRETVYDNIIEFIDGIAEEEGFKLCLLKPYEVAHA